MDTYALATVARALAGISYDSRCPFPRHFGRAARAACTAPTVHMNPVLLKPQSEIGAQIVVQGRVYGNARAADYQHITNPAYNADRGPVDIFGGRLHAEF